MWFVGKILVLGRLQIQITDSNDRETSGNLRAATAGRWGGSRGAGPHVPHSSTSHAKKRVHQQRKLEQHRNLQRSKTIARMHCDLDHSPGAFGSGLLSNSESASRCGLGLASCSCGYVGAL